MSPIHDTPPPLVHTTPVFSNTFAGTSSGFHYNEDMLREKRTREEECDGPFYAIYEQQQDMMEFIRESKRQTDRSIQSTLEAQHTLASQQHR